MAIRSLSAPPAGSLLWISPPFLLARRVHFPPARCLMRTSSSMRAMESLYGSNTAGHKIDVISMSTLQVVDQIRLNNGSRPLGMDLSPDGSELAVALDGASSIAFIDSSTRTLSATAMVYTDTLNLPYDVIYGRSGRAYSTGNPYSSGVDSIHIIDTATHTEIAKSSSALRAHPRLAISSDGNSALCQRGFSARTRFTYLMSPQILSPPKYGRLGVLYREQTSSYSLIIAKSSPTMDKSGIRA